METWNNVKDRLDALNIKHINIELDNDMPLIMKQTHQVEDLIPFHYKPQDQYAHFFLDDYQFERVWNTPKKYLNKLSQFRGVLSPDFSLFRDYPMPVQIWNTYRNRWLGQYWQQHGIKVIPTIVWSTPKSYTFCFNGIEKHSDIAISTIGIINDDIATDLFYQGYHEMKKQIQPEHIYLYGYICPKPIEDEVIFIKNRRFNDGR